MFRDCGSAPPAKNRAFLAAQKKRVAIAGTFLAAKRKGPAIAGPVTWSALILTAHMPIAIDPDVGAGARIEAAILRAAVGIPGLAPRSWCIIDRRGFDIDGRGRDIDGPRRHIAGTRRGVAEERADG